MGFGAGTLWDLGRETEARVRWDGEGRRHGSGLEAGGITELELMLLRTRIRTGRATHDPVIEVYRIVYPTPTDPEYEDWYKNLATEYGRTVLMVLPEFLSELCTVSPSEVESLAEQWGTATGHDWHQKYPDHSVSILRGLIAFAKKAKSKKMGVFASQWD